MKFKYTPDKSGLGSIFILFALFFVIAFLFIGCQPEELSGQDNKELIMIDINDVEQYSYVDLSDVNYPWTQKPNGYIYSYTLKGDAVSVESDRTLLKVVHYINATDSRGEVLEINNNSFTFDDVGPYSSFKITYR